jgi:uroporphyrinogen-III decarboxylase
VPDYEADDFYSSHLSREILGDDMHIGGWAADGFSRAIQWFPSISEAMLAMIDDPVKFEALVEYFDRISAAWARAQVELGRLESIQISSPYAGSTFISVDMYRRFVLPSVRRVAEAVRLAGGFSYVHTCGFISDRLEILAEGGADGIECMDPPPLGDVPIDEAKSRIGSRVFLKGNIDSVNLLLHGDDEQVEHVVAETIRAGKPGGGYILSTACSVAPGVPPWRVERLAAIAERDGRY